MKRGLCSPGVCGALLAAACLALSLLSLEFAWGKDQAREPILWVVGILAAAGAVYLWGLAGPLRLASGAKALLWLVLVGLFMRLLFLPSNPILEDDQYRYLWDGAVTASGHSPYQYDPLSLDRGQDGAPPELIRLAQANPEIVKRINYPYLRTIYPPLAQAGFALAHWIKPFSLVAWRLLLLLADGLTLWLLHRLSRKLGLGLWPLFIYWWNPLVIQQIHNGAHMDVLLLPPLLGALWLSLEGRATWSSFLLGLAVGLKLWPALLLPTVLRSRIKKPASLLAGLLAFALPAGLALYPIWLAGLDISSGLRAYGSHWEMNDSAFLLILWAMRGLVSWLGWQAVSAQELARPLAALLLVLFCLALLRKQAASPLELAGRFLGPIAALFLLSPTQFPWYYAWLLPFLALRPRLSLLLLTPLLALYYLRFYLEARGLTSLYDNGLVFLCFGPVWLLLAMEWLRPKQARLFRGEVQP